MSVDFIGIINGNEFYTNFYLATLFQDDLKSERKNRDEKNAFKINWGDLSKRFFQTAAQVRKERTREGALQTAGSFLRSFINALGYETLNVPKTRETTNGKNIPIIVDVRRDDGAPLLWALEIAPDAQEERENDEISSNPATKTLLDVQFEDKDDPKNAIGVPVEELLGSEIFNLLEPPRFVLLARYDDLTLIDRSKWNDKRYLRFDLREILGRRESSTLDAFQALASKPYVCPSSGATILDAFDDGSNKHARAVSDDLKYAARKAVELMGNEAVFYMREKGLAIYTDDELAQKLTQESLRYLYRLLFLFFLEARAAKLPYLPMNNESYLSGYSLESLRDLELTQTTDEAENGYFLDDSIRILFDVIYNGCYPSGNYDANDFSLFESDGRNDENTLRDDFRIERLESALFDPERTPTLGKVKFRNKVWQEIIRLLSLTREKSGKKSRRGRVSYATLGVSQLGAVYEGLLSYRGFFAKEDLYEVKKKGEEWDELKQGFFVPKERLEDYDEDERVFDSEGNLVVRQKGDFVYRLAGRDREKTASYYTPEQLTRCLVKYSLRELIGEKPSDPNYKNADEILKLTVCEPAMGSAAFLNEAISQLADAYLKRKQAELGEFIPADAVERETQRVRAYFADRNVFGVDVNPIAVELGEISLWLNSICGETKGVGKGFEIFVPWFGGQLVCGNSLLGARRQVYPSSALLKKNWHEIEPTRVEPGQKRPKGTVYHFLVPDPSAAKYEDKVVKGLEKAQIAKIDEKRKKFAEPYAKNDVLLLERFSDKIDELWALCVEETRRFRDETTDGLSIFGRKEPPRENVPRREKETRLGTLHTKRIKNSTPYRRLKLAMDYWCALWFWPIEKADLFPSRDELLVDLQFIFQGELSEIYSMEIIDGQVSLFPNEERQELREMAETLGVVDVDELCDVSPRLALARDIAEKEQRFLHWELEFADIFADQGGFDLIVGNPPWVKVEWNEAGVMSDYQPSFAVHKLSASQVANLRCEELAELEKKDAYLNEYVAQTGCKNFLNAVVNYPELKGQQTNLFKCFLPVAWKNAKKDGVAAFVHPEGVYDDPNGGRLRKEIYSRLRYHFQFVNELNLFDGVDHHVKYSINIYGEKKDRSRFSHLSNLFASSTIDESFEKTSAEQAGGIKDERGDWNVCGHQDRVVEVTPKELETFAKLYDAPGTPFDEARLPSIHARQLLGILEKFAEYPKRLGDIQDEYNSYEMWHETNAQKDHTIRRDTQFPQTSRELILQGPHFYVGNPIYKTPREVCKVNSDYDSVDLTALPENYLPRTNYVPDCSPEEYAVRTSSVPWDSKRNVTDYYRLVFRKMLSQAGERTLVASLAPKNVGHIDACFSLCFEDYKKLVSFAASCSSIPFDYFVKSTGKANFRHDLCALLPLLGENYNRLAIRCLLLNCLTTEYAELWRESWSDEFASDGWSLADDRLPRETFFGLSSVWNSSYPLRSDFSRRQALLELDVLVARALGLSLEELCAIYRIQFPVLRQNESDTWYDRSGRIVFTCSKGLTGVGFKREEWNEIKDLKEGEIERSVVDVWLPGAPERTITYRAPFDKRDREKDYRVAWEYFERADAQ